MGGLEEAGRWAVELVGWRIGGLEWLEGDGAAKVLRLGGPAYTVGGRKC